jgi:uncharacterized NAD(P)/FAD-binding protein YdhS
MDSYDAAIVGGGFAGTALAARLRATLPPGARILLLEPGEPGPGLAYGTTDPHHLLNVAAGGMSLDPDRPAHFAEWLARRPDAPPPPTDGGPVFAPRRLYGDYLREQLAAAAVDIATARIDAVRRDGAGFLLQAGDRAWAARRVALAVGGFAVAPEPATPGAPPPLLARDPWSPEALRGIDPDATVLLVGMGLTMVDLVLTLRARGHRGRIAGLSRHGWPPLPHVAGPPPAPWPTELPAGAGPAALSRHLRRAARDAALAGQPWQAVADDARPQLQRIWGGWTPAQRATFLRHGRSAWNLHRHRLAPAVAATLAAERAAGRFTPLAGRLAGWTADAGGRTATATIRLRAGGETRLSVGRIVLCMGPDAAGWRDAAPVPALLRDGLAGLDPSGLGLAVAGADGLLLDAAGQPVPGLHLLGPLTRGALWEITAAPEIRAQAARIAAAWA